LIGEPVLKGHGFIRRSGLKTSVWDCFVAAHDFSRADWTHEEFGL
jgi:hypothetical protein